MIPGESGYGGFTANLVFFKIGRFLPRAGWSLVDELPRPKTGQYYMLRSCHKPQSIL